jgi:hypothetical protein
MTMSDYDNRNRGVLFKNNDKTEETHPDYRGRLNVDGSICGAAAEASTRLPAKGCAAVEGARPLDRGY